MHTAGFVIRLTDVLDRSGISEMSLTAATPSSSDSFCSQVQRQAVYLNLLTHGVYRRHWKIALDLPLEYLRSSSINHYARLIRLKKRTFVPHLL